MNASPRWTRRPLDLAQKAAERIAARYGRGRMTLTANEALIHLDDALNEQHLDGTAGPTLEDLFDGLMQVDAAQVGVEWQELRLIIHAKVRYKATWPQISEARGFDSRQGAHERFKTLRQRYPRAARDFEEEARKAAVQDQQEGTQP